MRKNLISMVGLFGLLSCSGGKSEVSAFTLPNDNCSVHITKHSDDSGWILGTPFVVFDFWGDWSASALQPSNFENDWGILLNGGTVLDRLAEYGIHQGTLDSTFYYNTGSVSYADGGVPYNGGVNYGKYILDDSSFEGEINNEIQYGKLPYPNDETVYVIFLPLGQQTEKMIENSWAGYHTKGLYNTQRYAYAIVSYTTDEVISSHEIAEAATDPDGKQGYYDSYTGAEIGDVCQGSYDILNNIRVQRLWSQTLCDCQ